MSGLNLRIRPGVEPLSWAKFCKSHPPFSIALDGYVEGASRYDPRGPWLNLDHHAEVERLATRATCSQVLMCLRQGLFEAFRDEQGKQALVFANDCDEDVCLAWFLLSHPQLATSPNRRLDQLVQAIDVLDTTAGASLHPLDTNLLREIAWVFAPYRQARLEGALDRPREDIFGLVIDAVCERIHDHVLGQGDTLPLDTRYELLGGGKGWALVREDGPQSRIGMLADGIRAYVSVRSRADGAWSYVIGRASPFIPFDVPAIITALNSAEDLDRGTWGGGNLIGGSPRRKGSGLYPRAVVRIIERVMRRTRPAPSNGSLLPTEVAV